MGQPVPVALPVGGWLVLPLPVVPQVAILVVVFHPLLDLPVVVRQTQPCPHKQRQAVQFQAV